MKCVCDPIKLLIEISLGVIRAMENENNVWKMIDVRVYENIVGEDERGNFSCFMS